MYYKRSVGEALERALGPDGALSFLTEGCRQGLRWHGGVHYDPHLRNDAQGNERLSLYIGRTRTLDVSPGAAGLRFNADDFYRSQPCAAGIFSDLPAGPVSVQRRALLLAYLEDVGIDDIWWKGEGAIQNDVSRRLSVDSRKDDPFQIFDREIQIGDCEAQFQPIQQECRRFARSLSESDAGRFGAELDKYPWGAKADALAADTAGDLTVPEFKRAGNRIYLAPLQLAAYVMLWRFALAEATRREAFVRDMNALIAQKERLGLLPSGALRVGPKPAVKPALIVGGNTTKGEWERLREVLALFERDPYFKGSLTGLKVFTVRGRTLLTEFRL